MTRAANSSAGILGASPRTTNAANATASTNSSVVEPGSLTWATAMITATLAVKNISS